MAIVARNLNCIAEELKALLANHNVGQQLLADSVGVSQSTISRFLNSPRRKRLSKGIRKLCNYANIDIYEPATALNLDPCNNTDLISALREVWDGTPSHAKALAKVIRDLKNLR